jgi:hypothetical protein
MTIKLRPPGGRPRILAETTTAKLAKRIRATFDVIADHLPSGLYGTPAVDILLELHIAEEDATYLEVGELETSGRLNEAVTSRWLLALQQNDLVDRHGDILALSTYGHSVVSKLLETVYARQRALD